MRKYENVNISKLIPYENNARTHSEEQIAKIVRSIEEFGFINPVLIDGDFGIIAGHGMVMAARKMGMAEVPCLFIEDLTEAQKKAYILADNKLALDAGWDDELLRIEIGELQAMDFDVSLTGFDLADFDLEDYSKSATDVEHKTLVDLFVAPPLSVLDTRQGYWQDRKRAWKDLGIASEVGRDENLIGAPDLPEYVNKSTLKGIAPQTSIFDPVLCEIAYKWFSTDGGTIYDCFAGGSVRGIVAEKLGYHYTGIDLRQEQIDANIENGNALGVHPNWICDDSLNADNHLDDESVDLVFSCPPYADLEVYSDDPRDLSNMDYADFVSAYREIIKIACAKLKKDRFAVFVIGDIRDEKGFYRDFITDTKQAFYDAGLKLYNEMVLLEQIGTGAVRANRTFSGLRKVVKVHQNVLVFYKGEPKKIKDNYTEFVVENIEEMY